MNARALSSMAAALVGVSDCNSADPEVRAEQPAEAKIARRRALRQINPERVFTHSSAFLILDENKRKKQNEDSPKAPQKACDTSYLKCIRAAQDDSQWGRRPVST